MPRSPRRRFRDNDTVTVDPCDTRQRDNWLTRCARLPRASLRPRRGIRHGVPGSRLDPGSGFFFFFPTSVFDRRPTLPRPRRRTSDLWRRARARVCAYSVSRRETRSSRRRAETRPDVRVGIGPKKAAFECALAWARVRVCARRLRRKRAYAENGCDEYRNASPTWTAFRARKLRTGNASNSRRVIRVWGSDCGRSHRRIRVGETRREVLLRKKIILCTMHGVRRNRSRTVFNRNRNICLG